MPGGIVGPEQRLVTMSAGNYGRSFTEACVKYGLEGTILLPDFAPDSRVQFIEVCQLDTI